MNLDRHGSEPGYWTVTADVPLLNATPPEIAIGTQDVWHLAVWDDAAEDTVRVCRLLLRGPDAPLAVDAVDVPLGDHRTWTRVAVGASRIVRQAAKVYCS